MSVFLRWGVFGILGVAALLYAYNASKRLAESRQAAQPPAAVGTRETSPAAAPAATTPVETTAARDDAPAHCEHELAVARRAMAMRRYGEPLDRVLRIQEVAWQEPAARRQRLETVATRWFNRNEDIGAEALRIYVISDCVQNAPPP